MLQGAEYTPEHLAVLPWHQNKDKAQTVSYVF
jgi:hypothetical protein